MKETKTFKKELYDRHNELIVYGASVYGELAYYALQKIGIMPSYFCDQAINQDQYFGVNVIRPEEMVNHKNRRLGQTTSQYLTQHLRDSPYRKDSDIQLPLTVV